MTFIFVQFSIIACTALAFLAINEFNEWVVSQFHFILGINWLSLPAGLCVLATLLLGAAGTIGIFAAYLLLYFLRTKSTDLPQASLSALTHSVGPYLVYLLAERLYGLQASLANLTSKRLLLVIVVCSATCPALQNLVINDSGNAWDIIIINYLDMFAGNVIGALILAYFLKAISALTP